ncbi:molybdopterin converting factor subunit 1 [Paraburkholderia sp. Ac-20340]|uniref:molybdopterin converting factor subunit 1 n=1 Tax=Paraburkholderia sp. Ac-20340 TaxID=2703888 RepID=UPI001981B9D6|nr:molybdopterin converting factor subunit 1 [Paraburkholderia sp. Ac-20340]MBN3852185.1 molybdopterin converting factor subunit 1 [Paraburkholderia sp. Ac-20340]
MKLTIKYFASIREKLGMAQETLEIEAPLISISGLRDRLIARGPHEAEVLDSARPVRVAVNHEMVADTFVLRQDSEVAFFPPVTGG